MCRLLAALAALGYTAPRERGCLALCGKCERRPVEGRRFALSGGDLIARGAMTAFIAASSIKASSNRTGTRKSLPTLIVGMSPRLAAAYAESRQIPKYRLPASGTLIVSGFCLFSVIEIPHRIEFGFV